MTCVVSLVEKSVIYMGGDSAGVDGYYLQIRKDEKVFNNGGFLFGFTSSFRMGNILQYSFKPPIRPKEMPVINYLNTLFVDGIKKIFKEKGYDKGGDFLIGHKGCVYEIMEDFQVGVRRINYASVGCGRDIALGSLYSTAKLKWQPEKRLREALKAAESFSSGVRGPFVIRSL